jgi:hypothetical protein
VFGRVECLGGSSVWEGRGSRRGGWEGCQGGGGAMSSVACIPPSGAEDREEGAHVRGILL